MILEYYLLASWSVVFYIMFKDLFTNQEENNMSMRGAKHHSKTTKVLLKTLHKCNEISAIRETSSGWDFQATNGESFAHHPTSKTCHKVRSWLRKNTRIPEGIVVKITKS